MSVFATADLHGQHKQWNKIQDFCSDNDKIYVLGDCIDRSPQGFETLKSVLADPRVTLLRGNHEQLMMDTLIEERDQGYSDYWAYVWYSNGGEFTYNAWLQDGRDFGWITRLHKLPLWEKYTNQEGKEILLSHSGRPPKHGFDMDSLMQKSILWDREHLREARWHRAENEIFVHGHSPVLLFAPASEPAPYWYCEGHKCNIDAGSYMTGEICLLNLDTFEGHIFS